MLDRPAEGARTPPGAPGAVGDRVGAVVGGVVAIVVLATVATWTYQRGVGDIQYQLADLKEDPLYLRGPGFTIAGGIVVTVLICVLALVGRAIVRRANPAPERAVGAIRWHWWLLLVAGWGGYLAGSAVAFAAGGPILRPGTMRLELGAPLGTTVEIPATCKTVPGKPTVVASVAGDGDGLPYVRIADEVTGAPVASSAPGGAVIERIQGSPGEPDVAIPGLPDRPPMYSLSLGTTTGMQSGPYVIEHPVSFFRVYLYRPIGAEMSAGGGSARFEASRTYLPMVVDALVPNDPWPESFALRASWTCDLAATKPAPLPVPTPTQGGWTPPPVTTASPGRPTIVPVELRLATSAESASVEITGATVVAVDPPTVEGDATGGYVDGVFRVERSAGAAMDGRAVGATFRVSLRDVTAGSRIGLTIAGGSTGRVAVTIYNLLGDGPVPVFANIGTSADQPGWPIELDAAWLVEPVVVVSGL